MRYFMLTVIVVAFFSSVSLAASPPKGFFDEKINTYDGNRMSWGEVGELVQCLKEGSNTVSWETAGNSWIMHSKNTDKLTKKTNKVDWLFDYTKYGDDVLRVYLTRVIVNKEEIRPITILSNSNVMICWKKEAEEAKRESKRQAALEEEARIKAEREEESRRLAEIESEKEKDRLEFEANKRKMEAEEKLKAAEAARLKERAKQEAEIASIEKKNAITKLAGHYEIKDGSSKKHSSVTKYPRTIDVSVISADKIKFSLHTKTQRGSRLASCDIENQEATIEFSGKGSNHIEAIFGDKQNAYGKTDACFVSMKFKEASPDVIERMGYDYYVEVRYNGCESYCGKAGEMIGRYVKTSN